jgi:translation initiation factor 4E
METLQSDIRMDSIVSSKPEVMEETFHPLKNKWDLWAHLPHDTDWTVTSYKNIFQMTTVEESIAISETLPEILVKNCMLFIMKTGVMPIWEDKQNRDGGCFSYKISNKNVYLVWRDLTYLLVGESLSTNIGFVNNITGITISPKKNFCIIKIWMKNCDYQNPGIITLEISGIIPQGCLFKKHAPEY